MPADGMLPAAKKGTSARPAGVAQSVDFGVSALWSLLGVKRTCQHRANVVNDSISDIGKHIAAANPLPITITLLI
jgi:hypothetical protein